MGPQRGVRLNGLLNIAAAETAMGRFDAARDRLEAGLADAEGAMSDVNSIYDCGDMVEDPEMDDTSLSSRASSRIFDSDQIYSADSIHGM